MLDVTMGISSRNQDSIVHSVQLRSRRSDLLNSQLAKLRLQLAQLLEQIVLVLGPEGPRLDLAGRLYCKHCQ
jgi:hypothetical protein